MKKIYTYSPSSEGDGWDDGIVKQSFSQCFNFCFLLSVTFFVNVSYAKDSLTTVMQRMESETAVKIAYQETRVLELMDQPWKGSGFMYSMPPDLMIREQLQPQRLLMAVKGDKMLYYDPGSDVRHQGDMDEDNPLSLNIAVFKALINADEVFDAE